MTRALYGRQREREDYYDTAQVCANGHMVNSMADSYPQHNEAFCADCGQPTTTK